MGRATLEFEVRNLDALVEEGLDFLGSGSFEGEEVLRLARHLRQRACAALLQHLDVGAFQEGLQRAGLAYLHLLEHPQALSSPDPYALARSNGLPYLDALASGDRALAAQIAGRSASAPTAGMEDEDDFAYFAALGQLAAPAADLPAVDAALAAFEQALAGAGSPRLAALRAIRSRDAAAFDDALVGVVQAWEEAVAAEKASGTADPYLANIEAHVCVEGLALARVARWHGLPTEDSYPFLPGPAVSLPAPEDRPSLWS